MSSDLMLKQEMWSDRRAQEDTKSHTRNLDQSEEEQLEVLVLSKPIESPRIQFSDKPFRKK